MSDFYIRKDWINWSESFLCFPAQSLFCREILLAGWGRAEWGVSAVGFALGREQAVKTMGLSKCQNKGFYLHDNICSEMGEHGRRGGGVPTGTNGLMYKTSVILFPITTSHSHLPLDLPILGPVSPGIVMCRLAPNVSLTPSEHTLGCKSTSFICQCALIHFV